MQKRFAVGLVAWLVATFGGAFGVHLLAGFQPVEVSVAIVAALAVIAPFLAMRFVPSDDVRTLKSVVTSMFWAGAVAGGIGLALYDHWHEKLAVSNGSGKGVTITLDGHELAALPPGNTGSYKIPTGASEIVARDGETVVDRDTLADIGGDGTYLFDVGGKGCFERRTVTYGTNYGLSSHHDIVEKLALDPGHHMLRTKVDFVWHAESGVSVSKGESTATRDVLERCGRDD